MPAAIAEFTEGCHVAWDVDGLKENRIADLADLRKRYGYGPFYVHQVGVWPNTNTEFVEIGTERGLVQLNSSFFRLFPTYDSPEDFPEVV